MDVTEKRYIKNERFNQSLLARENSKTFEFVPPENTTVIDMWYPIPEYALHSFSHPNIKESQMQGRPETTPIQKGTSTIHPMTP